jgi:hypothetical protein
VARYVSDMMYEKFKGEEWGVIIYDSGMRMGSYFT